MNDKTLEMICDMLTASHARIQQDFDDINPLVGVNQKMREMGVPVDAVTIDCLKSGKRIILILHDQQPDILSYQFSFKDVDPGDSFEHIELGELTADTLYGWMSDYFRSARN